MAQITWRNINNPSFTGGNQAIESGNELLMSGLNRLANVGGGLERDQKAEQTATALDQINQLDRSGLATALANNEFKGLGNVDQSAISKALRGRDKAIDAEIDYNYGRDELASTRKDDKILGRLKGALAMDTLSQDAITSSGLSEEAQAGLLNTLEQKNRANQKYEDEQKVRDTRIQNETDADYINNTILGSEAQILDIQAQGGSADAYIQGVIQDAVNKQGLDLDTGEISKLRQGLLSASNPQFTDATKQAIADQVADETDDIQFDHDELVNNYSNLSSIASGNVVDTNSLEEQEAMGSFMREVNESHGDSSWVPNFLKEEDEGGIAAKQGLENIRQEGGYSVAELRAAMHIHSQGKQEGWGNPEVYLSDIRDTLKEWSGKKGGARIAKLAAELVPAPKTNSERDRLAYTQNLAKMQKSLSGPSGEANLAKLLKQREQKVKSSERSLNKRKRAVNSKARAKMAQSLRKSN